MRAWIAAIDDARTRLRDSRPERERFLVGCYGLDMPRPRGMQMRARLISMSMELNMAESTMYKWRENVLDTVVFCALRTGALKPFGASAEAPLPAMDAGR